MIDLSQLSDLEILTLTLIGEARGEPIEGQVAVASVIMNRARTSKLTVGEICLAPKQFSCWNENDPNRFLLDELAGRFLIGNKLEVPSYRQCLCVARGVLKDEILDNTHGSMHYLTNQLFNSDVRPQWASNPKFPLIKGSQTFFNI